LSSPDRAALAKGDQRWPRARLALLASALPPVLFVLVFFVAPLVYLLVVSFLTPSQTSLYEPVATLDNYARVLTDSFYLTIIRRTLLAAALILAASLLLGYPAAFTIAAMPVRWRVACLVVLLFPLMVSNVVRAYGWIAILGRRGLVNQTVMALGLSDGPLPLLYSLAPVVIGLLTILLPYMIVSITNALTAIDRSYGEAAQSLGAGPARTFLHVTLPLSFPGVATGCVLVLLLTLSAYVTIALLGGPRFKLLVSLIYDTIVAFQWPRAAALAFVLLAIGLSGAGLLLALLRPERVQGRG
jgi:putative spermidine/putrescine transport system permease protein